MIRYCCILFLGLLLFTACKRSKKDNPCDGAMCPYVALTPHYAFKLIDPATGHDLVYGPYAQIPLDSIKIQMPGMTKRVGQVIDTPRQTAVLTYFYEPPQALQIGRPGRRTVDKLNFLTRRKDCCSFEVYSLQLNENPVPVKQDAAGVFLIPYTL